MPVILFACFLLVQACTLHRAENNPPAKKIEMAQTETNIDFEKQILPVMVKNCSPCHFTGGKMYERLPFDKDTTIINHGERILKRIKNDEENTILKAFLLQYKNGLP